METRPNRGGQGRCRALSKREPGASTWGQGALHVIAEAEAGDAVVTVPTVRAFARTFLADCAERWKPATRSSYAHHLRRWIVPAFGNRAVDAVGAKDVRSWIDGVTATHPGSANWALAAMSSLMNPRHGRDRGGCATPRSPTCARLARGHERREPACGRTPARTPARQYHQPLRPSRRCDSEPSQRAYCDSNRTETANHPMAAESGFVETSRDRRHAAQ